MPRILHCTKFINFVFEIATNHSQTSVGNVPVM